MATEKERSKIAEFNNEKLRRQEKLRRDKERRENKFEKGSRRRR